MSIRAAHGSTQASPAHRSPARALVFAAILFAPANASADPPAADPPTDEETRRYCEEERWRERCRPGSRAGCFPDARCRVYEENRRREREGGQGAR